MTTTLEPPVLLAEAKATLCWARVRSYREGMTLPIGSEVKLREHSLAK